MFCLLPAACFNPLTSIVAIWVQHSVPDRVKPSFVIFDIRALWWSALNFRVLRWQKWWLNTVLLYSCAHMATVSVKGLTLCFHRHFNNKLPSFAEKCGVQCLAAAESLAIPSGDERVLKSSTMAEEGTTSGEVSLAAALAVSGELNLPVLALCTGLRTLSALRNIVISYTKSISKRHLFVSRFYKVAQIKRHHFAFERYQTVLFLTTKKEVKQVAVCRNVIWLIKLTPNSETKRIFVHQKNSSN